MPDAIYFKDARGRFIRANNAMPTRLGARRSARRGRQDAVRAARARDGARAAPEDEEVLRTGEAQHYRLEQRWTRPTGGEAVGSRRRGCRCAIAREQVVGVIAIFRDVTEQKRAEEKIHEAVRRRDQFLAMLSHELRNPLGAIVTATDAAQGDRPSRDPEPSQARVRSSSASRSRWRACSTTCSRRAA